ncbi:CotH kinase family protein [Paenibacillus mendelii]|uniref:CotH kinase family protein n=1 Tax=Paenibacillus mendelii TaxID=206163 RepID=A0ABV6JAE1_9BACL|nr:CotH kinase family protein [Paenibacillus mendelii]MCQ6560748.1 CotH kinase family protein [Paenibacillus mendelii]
MKRRRKYSLPIIALVCAAIVLIGITGQIVAKEDSKPGQAATSTEENAALIAEQVFPKDKVIDVKITIDADEFQDMIDNASQEVMKSATVEYNGIQYNNVGIRTKGNLSLRSVVSMTDSDRYSFKLSFDEYLDNQTLYGISKINLNNNYSDASYMREFLTYELASEMGLPTPGFSYVNVYVNGKLWGFYLAVEQIGDSYLEANFGNSTGELYKAEMMGSGGNDLKWIDDNIDSYSSLVRKSKSSDSDRLIEMLDELNNGSDYETVLDVTEALQYVALNVLTVNTDSYLGQNKQNYYLYEDDGIFNILPWDYNMAFGGLGKSSLLIDEPTQGAVADRPLIAKLLAVEDYKDKYHSMIRDVLEGYLANETFSARVLQVSDLISTYVEDDPSSFYTYDEYKSGVQSLVSLNASNVDTYTQQLDGKIAISGDGSGSGGGMDGFMGGNRGGGRDRNGNAAGDAAPSGDAPAQQNGATPSGNAPAQQNGATPSGDAPAQQNGGTHNGDAPAQQNGDTPSGNAPAQQNGGAPSGGTPSQGQPDSYGPSKANSTATQTSLSTAQDASIVLAAVEGGSAPTNNQGAQEAPNTQGNGQELQGGTGGPNAAPDGQAPNGQGGGLAPMDGQGNFGGGNGMAPPEDMGGGPDGMGGDFGGRGGMGGGGMGGFPGGMNGQVNAVTEDNTQEAYMVLGSLVVLALAITFIVFFKRKRI